VCYEPAETAGYTVTNTELSAVGFAVTAPCAAGYHGTGAAEVCATSGDYTLSGCTACTSQTGCLTDGNACSAVTDMTDKLLCDENDYNYLLDAAGTVTACPTACTEEGAECTWISMPGPVPDAGVTNVCLEVSPEVCVANEYASDGECLPCAAGTTSEAPEAGVTAEADDTACTATICAVDEFVLANACVPCAEGYDNALGDDKLGDDASGANTECTPIPTTGMCTGNTEGTGDVTCGEGLMLKPDPTTIEGTDEAACCDELPAEAPDVEYVWEATAWSACAFGCGTRDPQTRTVTCVKLSIYTTGAVLREDSTADLCPGDAPADEEACETLAVGTPCDDGNPATTGDECTAVADADDVCEGDQVLVSALTFDVDVADLGDLSSPNVAASIAASLTTTLAASLGEGIEVIILGLSAGSLIVDYKVVVPAATTVTEAMKSSAVDLIAGAAVDIESASGDTVAAPAPIVEAFKSYAYVRTAGTCPVAACSAACGYEGLSVADVYACQEDGASVAEDSCVSAGIGAAPSSETTCCPAADEATCEQSAAEVTAPPAPPPIFECADSDLTSQEILDCVKEETGLSGSAIAGIVVGIAAGLALAVYCICKFVCGGGEEEASKAPAGDVEAGGDDGERREVLEKRLAHVRNQMPEEQKP
jgi:hypothetical protein